MNSHSQVLRLGFGAGHSLEGHPECGRPHGHYFVVEITFTGDPIHPYGAVTSRETEGKAVAIVHELSGRNLNDMLGAAIPSLHGLAAYLLERLAILGVTRVEVTQDAGDKRAIVSNAD